MEPERTTAPPSVEDIIRAALAEAGYPDADVWTEDPDGPVWDADRIRTDSDRDSDRDIERDSYFQSPPVPLARVGHLRAAGGWSA